MLRKKFRTFVFNLGLFGEGDGEGGNQGGEGSQGNQEGNQGGEGGEGENGSAFATFPDEKSFMNRVNREAKKQFNSFIQGLGFNNDDELKTMIKAKREADEADKSDLEKALETNANLILERDSAITKANDVLKNAEAKITANALGVKPERISYLMKLIDLNQVQMVDGKPDSDSLKEQIQQIITDIPELVQQQQGGLPNKGGSSFNGNTQKPLSMELIKTMTKEEIASRMDEINAFMSAHPQKKK